MYKCRLICYRFKLKKSSDICVIMSPVTDAVNNLGLALLIHTQSTFCPISVFILLLCIEIGAEGLSVNELDKLLFCTKNKQIIKLYYDDISRLLPALSAPLRLASTLFCSSHKPIRGSYRKHLEKVVNAESTALDHDDLESSVRHINEWVTHFTEGKITHVVSETQIHKDAITLVNVAHFKGEWEEQFLPGFKRPFHCYDETDRELKYMSLRSTFHSTLNEELNCRCVRIYFKEKTYAFYVLLPVDSLDHMLKRLSLDAMEKMTGDMSESNLLVSIPVFTIEEDVNIKSTLTSLGVNKIFTAGDANLRGIDKSGKMYVSDIKHKLHLDVNEKGADASAVTTGVLRAAGVSCRPKTFIADKPFLFLIREVKTGVNVVIGIFDGS